MPVGGYKGAAGRKELDEELLSAGYTSTSLESICSMSYRLLPIPIKRVILWVTPN